ncbi:MAG TPA: hypothetical protein PLR37_02295 [Candidatus Accumulibacter phosphatis]|nr:hypothetical protein [Candidatus Accumulibacter phosphatis]
MSFPQGIDFRATSGYVTDPADHTYEIGITANYPRTTAQGNNVGWETSSDSRNRSTSPDARLAGIHRTTGTTVRTYRIDLPATGDYTVRLAAGDYSYSTGIKVELFDTTTSLGVLASTSTTAAARYRDATDAEHTAANWPANNNPVTKTFSTTILRAKVGSTGGGGGVIACLYVEAVAGGNTVNPSTGHVVATGYQPTVTQTDNHAVAPAVGHVVATGYQPTVSSTDHHTVGASSGHLVATGYQPTVSQSSGNVVNPAAGHALLTGYQPTVTRTANQTIAAATGHLVASGKQPTVVQTSPGTIFPLTGHAVLTGYQPIIIRTDNPAAVVDSAGARSAMSPAPIRIPVVDSAGMMTQAWKKWATSIYNRVGGPIAATNNELSESLPEDAGIEELKALLFSLADSSGQAAQSAAPIPPDDWMLAPTSSVQSLDTEIETRMAAMAEEIALLRTQINDMQQGLTL